MIYGTDTMLPFEIDTPTWLRDNFSEEGTQSYLVSLTFCFFQVPKFHLKTFDF